MVEWKKLKEVAVIKNGKDYKKLSSGNIPVYGTGGIMTYVNQFASDKPSVLLPRKGSVENIYYVEEPFWIVDTIYWTDIDVSKIIPKYLYIALQQYNLKEYAYGGARPSLSQQILYNLEIPIPSLDEQNRIVGILDTFTDSIENLKQQIAQRRKQYEFYRDQLLDLEGKEGVEMKTLGEIGLFIRGTGIQKADFVEEGFPCIHYGQIHTKYGLSATETFSFVNEKLYYKSKKATKGDVVLATTSEDAEGVAKPVAWLGDEDVAISGDAYIYHHNQNGKYLSHLFLSHKFMLFKIKNAT